MTSLRLAIGALACSAKLLALPVSACAIDHPQSAMGEHRSGKQLYGRGMWDHVPQASAARFAMGAASEVATVGDQSWR
jgi:hypothetical protein